MVWTSTGHGAYNQIMMTDTTLDFVKMHGLGNDFVIVDARTRPAQLNAAQMVAIADRHRGVGYDQLILLSPPRSALADVWMSIYNPDGSESGACGNATRCVAWLLMEESHKESIIIETAAGLLDAERRSAMSVAVDMGPARLDWREIPLSQPMDTLHLEIQADPVADPVAVNMGNPHAVFFVPDVAQLDLAALGPGLEHHPLFPERCNIEFAQIISRQHIRMRVWERSAGITQACGSGACATLVAAARRGLTERSARVELDGGDLFIQWLPDGHVLMTGPVAVAFRGRLDPSLLT